MAAKTNKKPTAGTVGKNNGIDNSSVIINSTTEPIHNQGVSEKQDSIKGRHFAFIVYPDSAPADWIDQLEKIGLPFVVSPLHDKDINPDKTPKKSHYHVIVSWGNSTTYRSARALCDMFGNCPHPEVLRNPTGHYRYLTHRDNPEKYQYTEQPVTYNGWTPPLDGMDVERLTMEIWDAVFVNDCKEYSELMMCCQLMGPEYFTVASKHTLFFKAICDGYRHNPYRILSRYYSILDDDNPDKKIIGDLIDSNINIEQSDNQ